MPRFGRLHLLAALLALVGAGSYFDLLNAKPAEGGKEPKLGHPLGHLLTDADRVAVKKTAAAHIAAEHKGDVLHAMHVSTHALREGKETPESLQKHEVQALVFNYTKGKAFRVHMDPATGKVTSQEEVTGMILSSQDERDEGKKLVETFKDHAKLMKAGSLVEGGFAVQAPKDVMTAVPHRYLEYHLTSADHKTLQRMVLVDLSDKKVFSSKAP